MKKLLFLVFAMAASTTAFAHAANVEAHSGYASEIGMAGDADDECFTTIFKGTIDSTPVTMTLSDMQDALDERGTMWKYNGKLTYPEEGVELKLDGYIRHQYLFLDAYDAKGNKIGHMELEGIYENDISGYQGTFWDPNNKEHSVKVIESK